jgi:Zn-dependent protease
VDGAPGQIVGILYLLPAILIGFTAHEFAHAFLAVRFGDDTPKLMGRFTLNPLKHVDPIGLLLVILFGYGWAKPVRYNPANLRKPIEHSVLIALAGPFSNLLLALAFLLPLRLSLLSSLPVLARILYNMVHFNLMLFVFNLLPIPPLDGSHLVFWAIPERFQRARAAYLRYGYWALAAVLLVQAALAQSPLAVDILPIGTIIGNLERLLLSLFGIPLSP